MLKVESCVTPSPEMWQAVIQGMRLPMKSLDRYDSGICYDSEELDPLCYICPKIDHWEDEYTPTCKYITYDDGPLFVLGKEDKRLALNLCKAGSSDRKFLRQLPVILTITAPEYFFRQLDQYKIATVTNSSSQMHTLLKESFSQTNFSFDHHKPEIVIPLVEFLNKLRDNYFKKKDPKAKKVIWHQILELIPQSFNYTKTFSCNYETLLNIINQRKNHPLGEWHLLIDYLLENVPYLKEFYEATDD